MDNGHGTPATVKAEFGSLECEIIGRAYGAMRDGGDTVDIRLLHDGHVVLNMPADMIEEVKPQSWRERLEAAG